IFYVVMIGLRVYLNPKLAPSTIGETITWRQRLVALKGLWGIGVLFAVLLVGIYSGFFTPTEAAAAGAFAVFVTVSGLPKMMASWIVGANLSPLAFIIVICILFLFLGCFMDAISMLL